MAENTIYPRELTSPDGKFRVAYNYLDGEKTPLIIEVRVHLVQTGELLVDLWRSSLSGCVHGFSADGFQIRLRDPFGPAEFQVHVAVGPRTFSMGDARTALRPLRELEPMLRRLAEEARQSARAAMPPPLPTIDNSLTGRLARWFSS